MEAELKLLFVAIGRCSERLIFAETEDSKAATDMFRWLEQQDLAVRYSKDKHAERGDVRLHHFETAAMLASGLNDCDPKERADRLTQMAKLYRLAGYSELDIRAMTQLDADNMIHQNEGISVEDVASQVQQCVKRGLTRHAEALLAPRMKLDLKDPAKEVLQTFFTSVVLMSLPCTG